MKLRLGLFFGTLYFIQGISEPTEGLIAQPVRNLLDDWGQSAGQIVLFSMLLSMPWALKPLFGLVSDFVPLWKRRRKSYLILCNAAAITGLCAIYAFPPGRGSVGWLLAALLGATASIAFGDVVTDALMIERGQPLQLTGYLQSVQWGCIYGGSILAGITGGYLSQIGRPDIGFLVCGLATIPALVMSLFLREPAYSAEPSTFKQAVGDLWRTVKSPGVLAVGVFLFLWNFNPFSTAVLQLHMKHELNLSDQFYGAMVSVQSAAMVVASVVYGYYCRRVPLEHLLHGSIVCGILATICYWAMSGATSAVLVTLVVGFTYMTGTLIQLDVAAQVCQPRTAGTVFAILMALSNLGMSLGMGLGGHLYEWGDVWWGSRTTSFNVLVGTGACFTACCWLVVPRIRRLAIPGNAPAASE